MGGCQHQRRTCEETGANKVIAIHIVKSVKEMKEKGQNQKYLFESLDVEVIDEWLRQDPDLTLNLPEWLNWRKPLSIEIDQL